MSKIFGTFGGLKMLIRKFPIKRGVIVLGSVKSKYTNPAMAIKPFHMFVKVLLIFAGSKMFQNGWKTWDEVVRVVVGVVIVAGVLVEVIVGGVAVVVMVLVVVVRVV